MKSRTNQDRNTKGTKYTKEFQRIQKKWKVKFKTNNKINTKEPTMKALTMKALGEGAIKKNIKKN